MQLSVNVYARFACGFLLILSALLHLTWLAGLIQLLLAMVLLRWLDGGWKKLKRSWKFLRWFVLPILILHALFTPGLAIVPGFYISVEGLNLGSWLAFRLLMLFISAIVFMNLLTQKEWLWLVAHIPWLGIYMLPYLLLVDPLYDQSQRLIRARWQLWQQEGRDWKVFGEMVACMIQDLMLQGQSVAQQVWNNWDDSLEGLLQSPSNNGKIIPSVGIVVLAIGWFFLSMLGL